MISPELPKGGFFIDYDFGVENLKSIYSDILDHLKDSVGPKELDYVLDKICKSEGSHYCGLLQVIPRFLVSGKFLN